jgi:hypothetical protein
VTGRQEKPVPVAGGLDEENQKTKKKEKEKEKEKQARDVSKVSVPRGGARGGGGGGGGGGAQGYFLSNGSGSVAGKYMRP